MRNLLPRAFIFLYSSIAVFTFNYLSVPPAVSYDIIAFFLLVALFIISLSRFPVVRSFLETDGRWIALFFLSFLTQFIVLETGGIFSRFFVLFDVLILAISFFYTFSIGVLFTVFALGLLGVMIFFDPSMQNYVAADPITPLLYLLSSLVVLPLSYVLAARYHFSGRLATMLKRQITVEDAILENLPEMIIVTDEHVNILSVNDAVERLLHRSREEMQNKSMFQVLYLKDSSGKLLTEASLDLPKMIAEQMIRDIAGLRLITTSVSPRPVTVQVRPILGIDNKITQLIFLIRDVDPSTDGGEESYLTLAMTRHQAMLENLRKSLQHITNAQHISFQLLLIAKANEDLMSALTIHKLTETIGSGHTDLAQLSKHLLAAEQEFASPFHVVLDFSFMNFTKEDISPLVSGSYAVSLDDLTGPFFTVPFPVTSLSFILQRLLTMSILIASTEANPLVQLSLERGKEKNILLTITANCPVVTAGKQGDLFMRYYGHLSTLTNLHLGSGLEGYLAQRTAETLDVPITVIFLEHPARVVFQLNIPKENTPTIQA